jgi:hypothetical protein
VHPFGFFPTKGADDMHMQGEGWQPFGAADDMGDAHQVVIYHGSQVIEGQPIGFDHDAVIQVAVFDRDLAPQAVAQAVMEPSLGILNRTTCRSPAAARASASARSRLPAGAVVAGWLLAWICSWRTWPGALSAEAVIGMAFSIRMAGMLLVERFAFRLAVGPHGPPVHRGLRPIPAQPAQGVHQLLFGLGHIALLVGVFNAQDKLAPNLAGQQVIIKGGPAAPRCVRPVGEGANVLVQVFLAISLFSIGNVGGLTLYLPL